MKHITQPIFRPLALGILIAASLGPAAALAEAPAPPTPPEPPSVVREVRKMLHADDMRVVKGAPYCADAVHESIQWLVDPAGGAPNKISRKTTTRMCRDGEGRMRQEVTGPSGRRMIHLHDPVAKEGWVLDPERKIARASPASLEFKPGEMGVQMREWARELRDKVREKAQERGRDAPRERAREGGPGVAEPVVVTRNETASDDGRERHVEVRIVRSGEAGMGMPHRIPVPPHDGDAEEWADGMLPPGVAARARHFAPRGEGVTTPLPAREIDGIKANGERTTWTVEAGKVGNEKPIVSTREVWTAPELLLTLQSREVDPRRGETSYRLSNLKRGEPDANLFKVPADYEKQRGLRGLPLNAKG